MHLPQVTVVHDLAEAMGNRFSFHSDVAQSYEVIIKLYCIKREIPSERLMSVINRFRNSKIVIGEGRLCRSCCWYSDFFSSLVADLTMLTTLSEVFPPRVNLPSICAHGNVMPISHGFRAFTPGRVTLTFSIHPSGTPLSSV